LLFVKKIVKETVWPDLNSQQYIPFKILYVALFLILTFGQNQIWSKWFLSDQRAAVPLQRVQYEVDFTGTV